MKVLLDYDIVGQEIDVPGVDNDTDRRCCARPVGHLSQMR